MTNLSPLPHFHRGNVPGTNEAGRCMDDTAGLSRFGEEREEDLSVKLLVWDRPVVSYFVTLRTEELHGPPAILRVFCLFFSKIRPGKIINRFLE